MYGSPGLVGVSPEEESGGAPERPVEFGNQRQVEAREAYQQCLGESAQGLGANLRSGGLPRQPLLYVFGLLLCQLLSEAVLE